MTDLSLVDTVLGLIMGLVQKLIALGSQDSAYGRAVASRVRTLVVEVQRLATSLPAQQQAERDELDRAPAKRPPPTPKK